MSDNPPTGPVSGPASATSSTARVRSVSDATRAALGKLAAPEAVAVMEDVLRAASGGNNNNNNNGGGGSVARAALSRQEMMQKVGALSDAQLVNVLQAHGLT